MIVSLEPELLARLSRLDGAGNPAANPVAAETLDADLAAAVRRTAVMRRLFYAAVLAVALYGTATGAVARFGLPWPMAIGGIFALELGGVVFLSNADTRRRLGEPAWLSRLLGTAVAGAAATFNLVTHDSVLLGGFFASMSVLGFLAWWLDVENKRRDRLRARGQLAAATPTFELWGHWMRHPVITSRARGFARAYPQLGLYGSLEAALVTMRQERRNAALADALHRRIRAAVSKDLADIAVLTYDMDEVAGRLRGRADYDGLTALLGSELTAERVLHGRDNQAAVAARAWLAEGLDDAPALASTAGDHREPRQLVASTDRNDATADTSALTTGTAHPNLPPDRLNGHAPNGHDMGIPINVSIRRLGDDLLDQAVRPMRSPGGPTAFQTQVGLNGERPSDPARATVQIRTLGAPAVLDTDGKPVRGLRTKSLELLVYLALHRAGASQSDIVAAIWPDATPDRAAQRLSTCLANLRSIIRQVREASDTDHREGQESEPRVDPVLNTGGRYRLDPAIVTVDWWHTVDTYAAAAGTAGDTSDHAERWYEISEALDTLARDNDYPWIAAAQEHARQDLARRLGRRPHS
jgi:hypothetical protein